MKPSYFVIFIVMFGLGVGGYFFIKSDAFPVLMVNGHLISTGQFDEHLSALSRYYESLIETKQLSDPSIHSVDQIQGELRRATLEQFIEDTLIDVEVAHAVGSDEEKKLVEEKLTQIKAKIETPQFGSAVENLYGISVERFKELALVPQARRELLSSRLAGEKKELDKWLADARKSASVHILLRGFVWKDGAVKVRE